jgi:hypothetical protein
MSAATKDILSKVRRMVPPMLSKFHKGDEATSEMGLLEAAW